MHLFVLLVEVSGPSARQLLVAEAGPALAEDAFKHCSAEVSSKRLQRPDVVDNE